MVNKPNSPLDVVTIDEVDFLSHKNITDISKRFES